MGQELLSICQAETRRLLWIAGIMFAAILVIQHLELPNGTLLSSILSVGKVPLAGKSSFLAGNVSLSNDVNNGTYAIPEIANNTRSSDFVLEGNESSDRTLEIDEDEDVSKEKSFGNLVKQNGTAFVDDVKPLETDFAKEWGTEPEQSSVEKNNTTC